MPRLTARERRASYEREYAFQKKHGVGLGIASFFVKAAVGALKAFPAVNAEIQGDEVVYKHYHDIGMAVGAEGGLVVPVLRNASEMSFAQIELAIRDFARRMIGMVDSLVHDAMADAFDISIRREPVDLARVYVHPPQELVPVIPERPFTKRGLKGCEASCI